MSDTFREIIYLPLGFLPSVFFTLRVLIQWYQSERKRVSHVSSGFWRLSLLGNVSLLLHYIIQVQYPFAMIQGLNAVISCRNINLMKSKNPYSTRKVVSITVFFLIFITLMFLVQSYFLIGKFDWIRTPTKPWDAFRQYHSISWHIFGTIGGIILSSRFWIQWWRAEYKKYSDLDTIFWYLSIVGSVMLVIYSIQIKDVVIFFYNCFGLIPYVRNLILIRKSPQNAKTLQGKIKAEFP